ncbi:EF-P 5-aminopentanol modification-associated protein YfmF [Streptococcus rifensis]
MKLAEGVQLHFIETTKYKTQRVKMRFSGAMDKKTLAGRVISAYILESANKAYPNARLFRQKLASLYGATFDTTISKKGAVHILDIDLSFLAPRYIGGQDLTREVLSFLRTCLFQPLTKADSFDDKLFLLEQDNLLNYLETEKEDNFYQADRALNTLFYQSEALQLPRQATIDLVKQESPQSTFRAFQKMLLENRIDFFFVGEFDPVTVVNELKAFSLQGRQSDLTFMIDQGFSKITPRQTEQKPANQSIIQQGYYAPALYGSEDYFSLMVLNGLLGGFAHSKLFVNVREKEGLAYSIGSQYDSLTACLKVYAGIDKENLKKTMKLIHQQLLALKQGQFSQVELEQTKLALKATVRLSQDRQANLIEQVYSNQLIVPDGFAVDRWLTGIEKVDKDAVKRIAALVKLQALYFMEARSEDIV